MQQPLLKKNRPNGYVTTADSVHEMVLNAKIKHCSAKPEKKGKVSKGPWQMAGCIMADVYMKFHKPRSLSIEGMALNADLTLLMLTKALPTPTPSLESDPYITPTC